MFKIEHKLGWVRTYDQLLLASKLQHRNIVKVFGYGHEVESSSMISRLLKYRAREWEYFWVEEYMPNGSLAKITHGKFPLKYHHSLYLLANVFLN
jgi:L1 cell adhesion molecule like protein